MSQAAGGELLVRMLKEEGVKVVFGIIDGTYFGFYSNLEKHGIRLITPRHETCAAHMAGAYARVTGKLGVCIASNGPGVANVLPGVAVENGEGNRVLLITSCRRDPIIYPDRGGAYQYFNQVGAIKPMSKWAGMVPSFARLPELTKRALRMSFKGRPGVVHLDVPENIMNGKFDKPDRVAAPSSYRKITGITPDAEQVRQAALMLTQAKKPLLHAGSGVLHAHCTQLLQKLAEKIASPVTTSWAARGAIPESSDTAIPMVHIEINNKVRSEADVVLAIGTRFGETDWWGKPPYWGSANKQKLIQVDIDEDVLGMNKPTNLAILGDAESFLDALLTELESLGKAANFSERTTRIKGYRSDCKKHRKKLLKAIGDEVDGVHSGHIGTVCQEVFGDDALMVADGGNSAVWANFYHSANTPHRLLSTFKFGMLGAGVSQALGAKAALPDTAVYCIIGDGAMGFHPQEIETAIRNDLPVIYVVLCDRQWGMVKINQHFALRPVKTLIKKTLPEEETINTDLGEIRFDKLAESMGAYGVVVNSNDELKPALEKAIASGKAAVVHVNVDSIKHMWAPGLKTFKEMHLEPKG